MDEDRSKVGKSQETIGFEWDGLTELRNDPPRWWMWGGYITIAFLIVYFILYPAIPLLNSNTKGALGWTQIDEYKKGLAAVEEARAPWEEKIAGLSALGILSSDDLSNYSVASTKAVFGDYCAGCHGAGGQGIGEYPSLGDDSWIYGGSIDEIETSIRGGREGVMNSYAGILSESEIDDLVKYVQALYNGESYEPGRAVFMGQTVGEADCVSCHGEDAAGMKELGSANLTDKIWRFDGSPEGIRRTIMYGVNSGVDGARIAVMPAWEGRLSESDVKKLAVKVWQLGGGLPMGITAPEGH